jgi:hypothetical protein
VVLGVASAPTVVMLFGCNVDISHLPPLQDELPNAPGTPISGAGTSSSSSSSSSASTSSSSGTTNPALSECDCVAAILAGNSGCVTCQNANCSSQYGFCQAGDCGAATTCAFGCNGNGPCIAACINTYPDYASYIGCLFLDGCAPSCGIATPITNCPVADAGTG